jgi:GDPmannose 4,6-dehydratase
MKHAIVVGSQGQDGRLLSGHLQQKGYEVLGIGRKAVPGAAPVDILDSAGVSGIVRQFHPDEIYYLAAVHHSSQDHAGDEPLPLLHDSFAVNVNGLLNFLEAARLHAADARLFYAASSHVFGSPEQSPQDERTPLKPACAYGISKTAGIHCCQFYRHKYNLFTACGILFNHESIYRKPQFVARKIVLSALAISRKKQNKLILGDLSAKVDWGYAPDYVDAMHRMLQLEKGDDFVVATGIPHSVQDFAEIAFSTLQLDWKKYVTEQKSIVNQRRVGLVGSASKLRRATGWSPTVDFTQMVRTLVEQAAKTPAD